MELLNFDISLEYVFYLGCFFALIKESISVFKSEMEVKNRELDKIHALMNKKSRRITFCYQHDLSAFANGNFQRHQKVYGR
jgi:hypothetical protein